MRSSGEIRSAQQALQLQKMSAVDLGFAKCVRLGLRFLQAQSKTLGRIWIPLEAIHPTSDVHDLKSQGNLRVRRWWAAERRFV